MSGGPQFDTDHEDIGEFEVNKITELAAACINLLCRHIVRDLEWNGDGCEANSRGIKPKRLPRGGGHFAIPALYGVKVRRACPCHVDVEVEARMLRHCPCWQATLKMLADWESEGRVKQTDFSLAPPHRIADACSAFGTDKICLVKKKTLVCGQAALVHLTSHSLVELGINARPLPGECVGVVVSACVPADRRVRLFVAALLRSDAEWRASAEGAALMSFSDMARELNQATGVGRLFELRKTKLLPHQVFQQQFGSFVISGSYLEPEDYYLSLGTGSDGFNFDSYNHFIVVNMGTRVVFGYPNVVVLQDEDIADPAGYLARLAAPPHEGGLSTVFHACRRGLVRQLFVKRSSLSLTNHGRRSQ